MKKRLYLLLAPLMLSPLLAQASATAHPSYVTGHLIKFEVTNKCVSCDLSGATLKPNHSAARLSFSNLSGVHANSINLSMSSLQGVNFSGADMNYANFSQSDLTGAHFDGAELEESNFYGAKNADLSNAKLCFTILPDGTQSKC